ncbi:MAG: GntR family transcriptional regulator [Alicyclobacillaceae bacterium]|nr:GntR family transcriptional regulator [Alicyclobacillaceae bacterium]
MAGRTEIAYEYLKQRILDGTFKPSQKLIEVDIAGTIGVSRNTLKKALLKLEQENLVTIEENKGATVKSFTLDEILNYLEIREVLEGLIARSAAGTVSEEGLAQLRQVLAQMAERLQEKRYDEYSRMNHVFHSVIYNECHNRQAVELVRTINTQLNRYHFRTILVPGRAEQSIAEHQEIYRSFERRDPELAEQQVKRHIAHVRQTIQTNYDILH